MGRDWVARVTGLLVETLPCLRMEQEFFRHRCDPPQVLAVCGEVVRLAARGSIGVRKRVRVEQHTWARRYMSTSGPERL